MNRNPISIRSPRAVVHYATVYPVTVTPCGRRGAASPAPDYVTCEGCRTALARRRR